MFVSTHVFTALDFLNKDSLSTFPHQRSVKFLRTPIIFINLVDFQLPALLTLSGVNSMLFTKSEMKETLVGDTGRADFQFIAHVSCQTFKNQNN